MTHPPDAHAADLSRSDDSRAQWLQIQPQALLARYLAALAASMPGVAHLLDLVRAAQVDDLPLMRALIRHLIFPSETLTWRDDHRHASQVEQVVVVVRELSARGRWREVQGCCEEALDALDIAMQYLDEGTSQSRSYDQLLELHLAACREAPPDSWQLASWLVRKRADCLNGVFDRAAHAYAGLLPPQLRSQLAPVP